MEEACEAGHGEEVEQGEGSEGEGEDVMTDEQLNAYNAMMNRINAMTAEQLDALVAKDECPFEPEHLVGVPIGMFHCEVCGEMVLAACPHPRKRDLP